MKNKLLIIGSSNTDMVVKTERFAQPGETLLAQEFFMFPGGKGANQAVAAARLGGDVTFVAKLGKDIFGDKAKGGFIHEGIRCENLLWDSTAPSGVALITVNQEGENTILVASGANYTFNIEDAIGILPLFSDFEYLLMQLEIPLETVVFLISKASQKGIKIILNPAPAQSLPQDVYSHIHLMTPNEHEAEILTGVRVIDEASAEIASTRLVNMGVKNCIITLGASGVYANTIECKGLIPTTKVKALDTTAAGDIFNGALGIALSNAMSMRSAIEFACKAATLSVTRMGAQSSAPYLHEIT